MPVRGVSSSGYVYGAPRAWLEPTCPWAPGSETQDGVQVWNPCACSPWRALHPQLRLCICLTFSALEPQARPRGPLCGPQLLQLRNSSVQCLDSPSCPTSCRNQCCCLAVSTLRASGPSSPLPLLPMGPALLPASAHPEGEWPSPALSQGPHGQG